MNGLSLDLNNVDWPSWIQAISSVVSIVVLYVLAKITRDYALATRSIAEATKQQANATEATVKEMVESRELTYRAELALWSVPHHANKQFVTVNVENVGSGPANHIVVECWWRDAYYKGQAPAALGSREVRLFKCPLEDKELASPPEQIEDTTMLIRISGKDMQNKPVDQRLATVPMDIMRLHGTEIDFKREPFV